MNVIIGMGIAPNYEEIVNTVGGSIEIKKDGVNRIVVIPINVVSEIQNDIFDKSDLKKRCYQLIDDMFDY